MLKVDSAPENACAGDINTAPLTFVICVLFNEFTPIPYTLPTIFEIVHPRQLPSAIKYKSVSVFDIADFLAPNAP